MPMTNIYYIFHHANLLRLHIHVTVSFTVFISAVVGLVFTVLFCRRRFEVNAYIEFYTQIFSFSTV